MRVLKVWLVLGLSVVAGSAWANGGLTLEPGSYTVHPNDHAGNIMRVLSTPPSETYIKPSQDLRSQVLSSCKTEINENSANVIKKLSVMSKITVRPRM